MNVPEKYEKPIAGKADLLYTIKKAIIASVPYVGGAAAEFYARYFLSPLEQRRDKWFEFIAEGLRALEKEVENFKIEDCTKKEEFITAVMNASLIAVRNHQQEKINALRNAILNSVLPDAPDEDSQHIFLSFIDELTPTHLVILEFFDGPKKHASIKGIEFPRGGLLSRATVLEHCFPGLKGKAQTYNPIMRDLFVRGLVPGDSIGATGTAEGMYGPFITARGKEFLKYISSPLK